MLTSMVYPSHIFRWLEMGGTPPRPVIGYHYTRLLRQFKGYQHVPTNRDKCQVMFPSLIYLWLLMFINPPTETSILSTPDMTFCSTRNLNLNQPASSVTSRFTQQNPKAWPKAHSPRPQPWPPTAQLAPGLESRFAYLFDSPARSLRSHVTTALASQATAEDDAELRAQWEARAGEADSNFHGKPWKTRWKTGDNRGKREL